MFTTKLAEPVAIGMGEAEGFRMITPGVFTMKGKSEPAPASILTVAVPDV